jgi:acyl dehydratase
MSSPVKDVYEDLQQYVGDSKRMPLGVIQAQDFQRFAIASGDLNPLFFDDEAAQRYGYPGAVAPPLYLSSVMGWGAGPPEESLLPDGSAGEDVTSLPLQGLRLMGSGQDLEFVRPVTDGTEITMERSVEAVQFKEGKSGPLILIKLVKRFMDGDGQSLVVSRESFIAR